jgi:DNA-binding HxlR family transcriptional regulator
MNDLAFDADACIMTRIFQLIGGKWKPIILYLIRQDTNRFGLMKKRMPRISRKMLTEQLRELEKDKLIVREVIAAKAPQVVVYHLTEKGRSLRQLIDQMIFWSLCYMKEECPAELIEEFRFREGPGFKSSAPESIENFS